MEKELHINVLPGVFCCNKRKFDTQNGSLGHFRNVQITTKEKMNGECREFFKYRTRLTSRRANLLFLLLRMDRVADLYRVCRSVLFLMLLTCVSGREQRFAIEPQDQSAVIGSRVTLPCRVENKAGQLQWTKDDFGLGIHRHLSGYERYMMIGSDDEGDFSLDIRNVDLDDDGLYQCQVSTGPRGESAIRSRYAKLIILAAPEPPRILQGSTFEAIEDMEVKLECLSVGGKPAAEITWVDHDGGVITQGVSYKIETMSDGHRFIARSMLRLKPNRHHHNQTFTCQAQNTADRAYKAAAIILQVRYAPKVKMFIKSEKNVDRISEGDQVILGCNADANPDEVTFKWFVNNEQIIGNFSKELILTNVSRKLNDATVKCEVYNAVGKSSASKTLEVSYGPRFVVKPQNVESEIGSTVTLNCLVDSHPHPEILWLHYAHDRMIRVGKNANLSVIVNLHTAGLYWCKASVEGFSDIEAQAQIYIKGPPKIMTNKTQYGIEGDSVRIECISFSIPKPDYVLWSFGGHEINSIHNQEYAFLEETLPEGITKSTLIIRDSVFRHFGRYNCSVSNVYGFDSVEIHLMPDKSFPLIVLISAGGSAAGLVAIVLLLIILCHRRRRKNVSTDVIKKPDITDIGKNFNEYKETDRSSNISDMKLELRQVEGSCEMDTLNPGSEAEYLPSLPLNTNLGLGLPLAGPVSLPPMGYDNELMKQYQRYSTDFIDPNSLHFKVQNQSNGYVPYVDYSRDYIPPVLNSNDSLNGSMSRSIDTTSTVTCNGFNQNSSLQGLGHRQRSCNALSNLPNANIGPDVIPMTTSGVILTGGMDVRYAATYGNPYLRSNGQMGFSSQVNTANPAATPAPPPYYAVRNSTMASAATSPSVTSSGRTAHSPVGPTASTTSSAQPQVPKQCSQGKGSLYVLPQNSRGNHNMQITTKGTGVMSKGVTHV